MKYIALLRGINVGGHNKIKMNELREMFSSIGYKNVQSYINSGNIIFDARKTNCEKLVEKIEKAIEKSFELKITVAVRESAEIVRLVKENPFKNQLSDDRTLFVAFLSNELSTEQKKLLLAKKSEFEEFAFSNSDVFCLTKKAFLDGLLGKKFIDTKLKTPTTVRNWRTVNKLLEF